MSRADGACLGQMVPVYGSRWCLSRADGACLGFQMAGVAHV